MIISSEDLIIFLNIVMDKELLSYAYLLQSGYTHKELKELLIEEASISAKELWEKTKNWSLPPLKKGRSEKIREHLATVNESTIEALLEQGRIDIVTQKDSRYPKILKTIGHAPAFFYLKWKFDPMRKLVWVVWSRKHTAYAEQVLLKILPDLVSAGLWIISGGATGVDTLGHKICLDHKGYTLAILWTGIDITYPAKNRELFEKIVENDWAILSHFPLWVWPEQYNFPMRNELVAAMSQGIIIPEAWLSSGTLITAQLALEHGRDVFAVPGDIYRSTSEGTNMLIATWQAKCVRYSGDILEEYFDVRSLSEGMTPVIEKPKIFETEDEKRVYESIALWYSTVDELLESCSLELTDLLSITAFLEIRGYIHIDQMGRYQRNSW